MLKTINRQVLQSLSTKNATDWKVLWHFTHTRKRCHRTKPQPCVSAHSPFLASVYS